MPRGAVVFDCPDQRRPRIQAVGELWKTDVVGVHAGDDLVPDLPHRRGVIAQKTRGHFFLARRATFLSHAHKRHVAANVLAQQLVGFEQIVFVVLLEHAHTRRLGERTKMHRGRIDRRGNVHEAQRAGSPRELQVANIADQGDIRVVDRHRELRLIIQRRRQVLRDGGCGRDQRTGGTCDESGAGENERREPCACRHQPLLGNRDRNRPFPLERRRPKTLQPPIDADNKPQMTQMLF